MTPSPKLLPFDLGRRVKALAEAARGSSPDSARIYWCTIACQIEQMMDDHTFAVGNTIVPRVDVDGLPIGRSLKMEDFQPYYEEAQTILGGIDPAREFFMTSSGLIAKEHKEEIAQWERGFKNSLIQIYGVMGEERADKKEAIINILNSLHAHLVEVLKSPLFDLMPCRAFASFELLEELLLKPEFQSLNLDNSIVHAILRKGARLILPEGKAPQGRVKDQERALSWRIKYTPVIHLETGELLGEGNPELELWGSSLQVESFVQRARLAHYQKSFARQMLWFLVIQTVEDISYEVDLAKDAPLEIEGNYINARRLLRESLLEAYRAMGGVKEATERHIVQMNGIGPAETHMLQRFDDQCMELMVDAATYSSYYQLLGKEEYRERVLECLQKVAKLIKDCKTSGIFAIMPTRIFRIVKEVAGMREAESYGIAFSEITCGSPILTSILREGYQVLFSEAEEPNGSLADQKLAKSWFPSG